MCCPIMSVIFGKVLYLIAKKKAHNDFKRGGGKVIQERFSLSPILRNL
jgi:hypothetical protein